jgi:hypothetical protein
MQEITKLERCNTYENFFRIIVLSSDQEWAENRAKWLTGNENQPNSPVSTYRTTYHGQEVKFIAYARSSKFAKYKMDTVAVDGICVFVENQVEWADAKAGALKHFLTIPVKLIVSDSKLAKEWAKEIGAVVLPGTAAVETIKNTLDALDREEFYKIKSVLESYDTDRSGYIEKSEIPQIARQMGMDVRSQEFQMAMLTLDSNRDSKLDINEFILWYKIGRMNSEALVKVSELSEWASKWCKKVIDYDTFANEKNWLNEKSKDPNQVSLKINTGCSNPISRVGVKLIAGNQEAKLLATKNFLSKFTDLGFPAEENWLDITVFVNSLTYKGYEIEKYLENFRQRLIDYADKHFLSGLSNFIKKFVVFRFFPQLNSGTIVFKLKDDVFEIVHNALYDILTLKDFLTDEGRSIFDLNINITSEECIGKLANYGGTFMDLLKNAEVSVEGSCLKHRFKALMNSLTQDYKKWKPLLEIFFAPNTFKLKHKGPIEDLLVNEVFRKLLGNDLSFLKPFGDFIRANFDQELLDCMRRLEIGINCYDIFANIQVFSDTLWK